MSEASYRRSDTKISWEAEWNEGRLVEIGSERPTSFPKNKRKGKYIE